MKIIIIIFIGCSLFVSLVNYYIYFFSKNYIISNPDKVRKSYVVLVPGALVRDKNTVSPILHDRLISAYDLYKKKKVKRFLLTGDHGTVYYDEVNTMKNFLLQRGVPRRYLFLDHAGFNTYNSMVRAKKIFQVEDVVIVTQKYHLYRSVYIARKKGLKALGFIADKRIYFNIKYYKFREIFANVKAFVEVLINRKAKFLGAKIPITGNSEKSWD